MNDEIEVAPNSDEDLRQAAIASLKRKREFTQHVVAYIVVNALLVGIWAVSGGGYFWPIWVIGGWGIGVIFHGWDAYGRRHMIGEEEIADEMQRLRR